MPNQLTKMAEELLMIEEDFPQRLRMNGQNATVEDYKLHTFLQMWPDTTIGFGGIGGQAMTTARSYVFIPYSDNLKCLVYIAGQFAYTADYSDVFMQDVTNQSIAAVYQRGKYPMRDATNR